MDATPSKTNSKRHNDKGKSIFSLPKPRPLLLEADKDEATCYTLIAKAIADIKITPKSVEQAINRGWGLSELVTVEGVDPNIFIISFANEADYELAWSYRPWSVSGFHLILKEWSALHHLGDVNFDFTIFWVQVVGLPSVYVKPKNVPDIAEQLGHLIAYDIDDTNKNHKTLRVRIRWDINKALVPGCPLPRKNLPDAWVHFKYEKLSEFCLHCGRLGHTFRNCHLRGHGRNISPNAMDYHALGYWMRTGPTKYRGEFVTHVADEFPTAEEVLAQPSTGEANGVVNRNGKRPRDEDGDMTGPSATKQKPDTVSVSGAKSSLLLRIARELCSWDVSI